MITHYHYENWPDLSTPELAVFKEFLNIVYQKICKDRLNNENGPAVLHCHAGSGRTGVMIACLIIMDYIQEQIRSSKELKEISINIPELILEMKSCRSMINNFEQYLFVKEWLENYVRDQIF